MSRFKKSMMMSLLCSGLTLGLFACGDSMRADELGQREGKGDVESESDCSSLEGQCQSFCPAGALGDYGELGCTRSGFVGPERCCKREVEIPQAQVCGTIPAEPVASSIVGPITIKCEDGSKCIDEQGNEVKEGEMGQCSSVAQPSVVGGLPGGGECNDEQGNKGQCNSFCADGALGDYGELGCTGSGVAGPERCCKKIAVASPDDAICGKIIGGFVGYLEIKCLSGAICDIEEGELLGTCKSVNGILPENMKTCEQAGGTCTFACGVDKIVDGICEGHAMCCDYLKQTQEPTEEPISGPICQANDGRKGTCLSVPNPLKKDLCGEGMEVATDLSQKCPAGGIMAEVCCVKAY